MVSIHLLEVIATPIISASLVLSVTDVPIILTIPDHTVVWQLIPINCLDGIPIVIIHKYVKGQAMPFPV